MFPIWVIFDRLTMSELSPLIPRSRQNRGFGPVATKVRAANCYLFDGVYDFCHKRCLPNEGRPPDTVRNDPRFWLSAIRRRRWYLTLGSINVQTVATPKVEIFYWVTITFSQTLGTALGDWMADTSGLGYAGGALVFGAGLAVLAALYFWTDVSRVLLFWAAFILTRPLGATVGDFLDKPIHDGGLAFSRAIASAIIAVVIVALVLILPQRAGRHPGGAVAEAS